MRTLFCRAAALLCALILVAGCAGTLSIGFEQTPTPDLAPNATVQALIEENERLSEALATAIAPPPVPTSALGRLAYIRGGDLWVAVLPEGPHQRLTIDGHNREPRWSPGGEWIAYRKDRTVLVEREGPCEEALLPGEPLCRESISTFQQQLWLARRNGASHHVLNRGLTVERFAWSPVDDLLAFVTEAGHLQTLNPNTDLGQRLVDAGSSGRVSAIAWSPDGRQIAYQWATGEETDASGPPRGEIWVVSVAGGEPTRITRPGAASATLAGWRDERHVLVWQQPGETALNEGAPLEGAPTAAPAGGAPASGAITEAAPDEDGVWLFSVALDRAAPQVEPVPLHPEPMLPLPDFVAAAALPEQPPAVTLGGAPATWTDKRIVAGAFLSAPQLAAITPTWSRDGERLAFAAMPDMPGLTLGEDVVAALLGRKIWVAAPVAGAGQQLTRDARYRDERPLWSAQGGHLLFARVTREGQASLWLVPATEGAPALVVDELTPAPDPVGNYGYIDWSQHYDWWRG